MAINDIHLHFFPIDESIEGYDTIYSENSLKEQVKDYCKPCQELEYCPYGVLVEGYPLPSPTRIMAIEHNKYLKSILEKDAFLDEKKLSKDQRQMFQEQVDNFKEEDYPLEIPKVIQDMSCPVFGHLCPVYFCAESGANENGQIIHNRISKGTRNIPRAVLIRVVRRDNSMCQLCKKMLLDDEIQIDHIIPYSKGGPTKESNLRVLCEECNKRKGNK
ncbi:MAG: HNH endonuclease domain protein [candidate division WS6 bacterium GW2011_GWC1_36_11]|uniref:HNH endonuclease domain protein n=1 Tax=candidate division WS6 bacterium GW2011_GWC1_36_11 TaxID=1619090 RepID=A0A0G0DHV5_9BACT|nr:MAG: HNH endonuclease domain protein [candidate division WS6 bacterium GW2011_GWC1_36_11]KKQ04652.1 MAG: HNH endonuclease domain protein [candidate division WS6 bacterium GW2011_WS6_36_26]